MKFWIVDAFSDIKFKGNPAGVCIVEQFPAVELMQNIATEINASNTAFVMPISKSTYHIKWFTPHSEAPLCGHATVASIHILSQSGMENDNTEISFHNEFGDFSAIKRENWIHLNFPRYEAKETHIPKELYDVLDLKPLHTSFSHNCYMMEFSDPHIMSTLKPDLRLLSLIPCRALIITARGDGDFKQYDFISRYFAPSVGIDEDPVCASAHCRLIPYWSAKLGKDELLAYQSSMRGGILRCRDLRNRVQISGTAVTVASGQFWI